MDDPGANNLQKTPQVFEVLTFRIAWQRLGMWPGDILEIVEEKEYVPIPFAPPFLKGIVNSHGKIVTVVDFPRLVDLPADFPVKRVAVLDDEDFMIGLLVPFDLEISFFRGAKEEIGPSKIRFFKRTRFFSDDFDSEIDIFDPADLLGSLRRYFKDMDLRSALPKDLKWI